MQASEWVGTIHACGTLAPSGSAGGRARDPTGPTIVTPLRRVGLAGSTGDECGRWDMDDGPRVWVVIPAFENEHYIRATLESVLAQTYRNFEVVVADHGSTDRTWEIL